MPTLPERVATIEANFASLIGRLDRQVVTHGEVHRDLVEMVKELKRHDGDRERREQRLIGAFAVLILLANVVGPIIVPIAEAWLT